ncbi:DgyrCDS8147 [Dimorphilus gyrociliatus]|uniref:DgyrCDS8147 n=1 Tax=Dimorphilus gyrociliatus TaxID=2664684 RepID=A0A7I8VYF8_9ANNE|nr:DgyrCDS8147 [Dimorphilus gyrociliatus]
MERPTSTFLLFIFFTIGLAKDEGRIIQQPTSSRLDAGSTATLDCKVENGQVSWYKNNVRLHVESRKRFKVFENNTLQIRNVRRTDNGVYRCSLGSIGAQANLTVFDRPLPPKIVLFCNQQYATVEWKTDTKSNISEFAIEFNSSYEPDIWMNVTGISGDKTRKRIRMSPYGNYSFRVKARNRIGWSKSSKVADKSCQTDAEVPRNNPRRVCTVNESPGTMVITWQHIPLNEQNGPNFRYIVSWRESNTYQSQNKKVKALKNPRLVINMVPIFREYLISVTSTNIRGETTQRRREWIGYSGENTPELIPKEFSLDPSKRLTSTSASFHWKAVDPNSLDMNGYFTGYKIEFWPRGGKKRISHNILLRDHLACNQTKTFFSKNHETNGEVINLRPFITYTAVVRVMNMKYSGPASNSVSFTTLEGVPGEIVVFYAKRRSAMWLLLQWYPPEEPRGVIRGYILSYKQQGEADFNKVSVKVKANFTQYNITNLRPGKSYDITLRAYTSVGEGNIRKIIEKTVPPPSGPKVIVHAIPNQNSINVSWRSKKPTHKYFVKYKESKSNVGWRESVKINSQNTIIKNLKSPATYKVQVIAVYSHGIQSPSDIEEVKLGDSNFYVSIRNDPYRPMKRYLVEAKGLSGDMKKYYIQYRTEKSFDWKSIGPINDKAGEFSLYNLKPRVKYFIRARAENRRNRTIYSNQTELVFGTLLKESTYSLRNSNSANFLTASMLLLLTVGKIVDTFICSTSLLYGANF